MSLVNANFFVNQMSSIICRWNLVKHLIVLETTVEHKIPEISSSAVLKRVAWLCSVIAFLMTFPHNLDSQNKQGAQKGKHLRNQRWQFCLQWNLQKNEGEFAYKCKWNEIHMYHRGCKHKVSSIFFSSWKRKFAWKNSAFTKIILNEMKKIEKL